MKAYAIYLGAAVAEIAGCYAVWAWLRLGKSIFWVVPGVASLLLFAFLLTLIESRFAGRTYAAYGGVYIAVALAICATIGSRKGSSGKFLMRTQHCLNSNKRVWSNGHPNMLELRLGKSILAPYGVDI